LKALGRGHKGRLALVSTELREPFEPRDIALLRTLRTDSRNDLALVSLSPPIERFVYSTAEDLAQVILATRLQGQVLFPKTSGRAAVYIINASGIEATGDFIPSDRLKVLDWGEVYRR
jgi:hypothetical protein